MKCAIKFAVLALIGAASSTMVRWCVYIHSEHVHNCLSSCRRTYHMLTYLNPLYFVLCPRLFYHIVLRQQMPMLLLTSSLTKEEITVMELLPVVSKIARNIVRVALAQKRDVGDITGLTIVTVTSVFVTTAGYVSLQGTKVMKMNSLLMSLPTKSTPMIRVSMM